MTQAFNLSQLANFVDSSGKISLTTAVTGILPVANGGTGTSTPAIVAGTGILVSGSFPNQTVTCTVTGGVTSLNGQTGAITDTSLFAIGSYITGRPGSSSSGGAPDGSSAYSINTTYAGTSMWAISTNPSNNSGFSTEGSSFLSGSYSYVGVGSWRLMTPIFGYVQYQCTGVGLWVRYA